MGVVDLVLKSLINFIDTHVELISDCEQQESKKLLSIRIANGSRRGDKEKRGANEEQSKLIARIKHATKRN